MRDPAAQIKDKINMRNNNQQTTNDKEQVTQREQQAIGGIEVITSTNEAWANIPETPEEKKEVEQARKSAEYEVNPSLLTREFIAKPVERRKYGQDIIRMQLKLHPNYAPEFDFERESDFNYVRLCGVDRDYKVKKVGWLFSRKKGKEDRKYLGVSIDIDGEIYNIPIPMDEFKNFEKIGFFKKVS